MSRAEEIAENLEGIRSYRKALPRDQQLTGQTALLAELVNQNEEIIALLKTIKEAS